MHLGFSEERGKRPAQPMLSAFSKKGDFLPPVCATIKLKLYEVKPQF
jgi:hypothetical protein